MASFVELLGQIRDAWDEMLREQGAAQAVAVASGTAALQLACLGLVMEPGETGITSPITFAASANCILDCGGNVAFVGVDPRTGLLGLASLENELTLRSKRVEEPGVVIAVSLVGKPANLPALKGFCDEDRLSVEHVGVGPEVFLFFGRPLQ